MFKKTLTALAFLLFGLAPAMAGNVTIPPGPQDPSNMGALINTLIISGNQSWAPQGNNWLTTAIMTNVTSPTIAMVISGTTQITPTQNVSWLKLKGYISNTTTPTFFMIPLWACPLCT